MDFAVPCRPHSEKKSLDLARELKKLSNMRVTVIPIVLGSLGTVPKGFEMELVGLEIEERIKTIQTTAFKICQHTGKSPGDLRRLAVT